MTVVTSTGKYLTVNAYQHPDLFWALRGGGGGTWGVVVSVTYQTHPSPPILAASFLTSINVSMPNAQVTPSPTLRRLFTEFVRLTPAMADSGWSGYADFLASEGTGHPALRAWYIAPATAWETAVPVMEQFYAFARELAANSSVENGGELRINTAAVTPLPSFGAWETMLFRGKSGQVGENVELGSRLLPRSLLIHNHTEVAEAVLDLELPFTGF